MTAKTKAKTAASQPTAKTAAQDSELTPIQQLIADEIGDMIARGGERADVDSVLWHALASMKRRELQRFGSTKGKECEAEVTKDVNASFDRRKAELVLSWKQNNQSEPGPDHTSHAIAHRIRAAILERLQYTFDKFLGRGTPEEHRLLLEILQDHEGCNLGPESSAELALGYAFEYQLESEQREYVRVPRHLRGQVDKYLACLIAADATCDDAA
jgi:hypothetical protein